MACCYVRWRSRFNSFNQGKILLGATHENEQAWDLEETVSAFQQLLGLHHF